MSKTLESIANDNFMNMYLTKVMPFDEADKENTIQPSSKSAFRVSRDV